MKISDAHLKIQIGANLTPETVNLSGPTFVGTKYEAPAESTKAVFVTRLFFSASSQTAALNPANGVISLSAIGTQQVFTRAITAPAGATSVGMLSCTLTAAAVSGSPLAVNIPLNPTAHTNATQVAAAMAAHINKEFPGITARFRVTSKDARVIFTSIYAFANDASASLAITTGLGVSAGDTAGAVSGLLGVISQRQGGSGKDIFGDAWNVDNGYITDLALNCLGGSVTVSTTGRQLFIGQRFAWSDPFLATGLAAEGFTSNTTPCILDVIALCR